MTPYTIQLTSQKLARKLKEKQQNCSKMITPLTKWSQYDDTIPWQRGIDEL